MADHEDGPEGRGGDSTNTDRVQQTAPGVMAVAVAGVLASGLFDVPVAASALGVAVTAGAIVIGALSRGERTVRARRSDAAATPSPWPDIGMRLTLDAIEDPCFLTDDQGIVRYQNQAAVERFGACRPGDPLSFKLRVPELLAGVDRAGRGDPVNPVRFAERVPTERFYVASARAIRRPRRDGRLAPKADFVLIRLQDETDLVRMDRMRGDFIANASHELRTPLASLTGFVETLLGPARKDEVNRERFLRIMLDQAQRMARLIDDLLSLSRIEMKAHVRPNAPVDLADALVHVMDAMSPVAALGKGSLERSGETGPAMVRGDRDELIQVVSNLVENALKYGGEGVTVEVRLAREAGPAGRAGYTVTVSDNGPGIEAEHLPRLTERFYRVDADRSRATKGTGLGLAIVKHIVNRHHGRLSIRSRPGEGTTVQVWLEGSVAEPRFASGGASG